MVLNIMTRRVCGQRNKQRGRDRSNKKRRSIKGFAISVRSKSKAFFNSSILLAN
ncbi:hypothetical protein RchiOBHm_Chr4g0388311 [Rosa chinensis]|uniref:Uncharacterized protein n=1 Tax=Rosa chinensis TaxID=74649 RepID=A0A2P6QPQ1_ROSCH|nr:hypothetical protein RchiOBHm_Chr4g0388311 [Rosa chinensis]